MTRKEIEGYPNYLASDDGTIYNRKTERPLKPQKQWAGYKLVTLTNDSGKRSSIVVHRLIAKAFVPNPDNLPQVNHINGIKADNSALNLEWVTGSVNVQHAYDTGVRPTLYGEATSGAKLTDSQVLAIRAATNVTQTKLADEYGVSASLISMIRAGKRWPHLKG